MLLMFVTVFVVLFIAWYVVWGRPWLKKKEWAQGFYRAIEPVEIFLFKKSESILWARTLQALGVFLTALAGIGEIDLTPFLPFVPDQYKWMIGFIPLVVTVAGAMGEKLRNSTTKPIEVVAVPEDAPPAVKLAVKSVEMENAAAVAVVQEAKVEGKV